MLISATSANLLSIVSEIVQIVKISGNLLFYQVQVCSLVVLVTTVSKKESDGNSNCGVVTEVDSEGKVSSGDICSVDNCLRQRDFLLLLAECLEEEVDISIFYFMKT